METLLISLIFIRLYENCMIMTATIVIVVIISDWHSNKKTLNGDYNHEYGCIWVHDLKYWLPSNITQDM